MFLNAKNGTVKVGDTDMDYISFGKGKKILVMLPGLGDGLKTVKGTALVFSTAYRKYARDYKVYAFSRKNRLQQGYTTRDMAKDQAEAMRKLGISKADIIGVSQGGMIAQYMAIDYPELVRKLVLAVTMSKQNKIVQRVVKRWIGMAKSGDYKSIIIDTAERSYSDKNIWKYRLLYPIMTRVGKPKDFSRFIIQAHACLNHDSYKELDRIKTPTLIIGGDSDKIVGSQASKEIAEKIRNSKLVMYKGLGHGTYEEAEDFHIQVLKFLK